LQLEKRLLAGYSQKPSTYSESSHVTRTSTISRSEEQSRTKLMGLFNVFQANKKKTNDHLLNNKVSKDNTNGMNIEMAEVKSSFAQ
jgi:hypothetical protein